MKKLNWNTLVKVRLNDYGEDLYIRHFSFPLDARNGEYHIVLPHIDEDGLAEMPLWEFMQVFGEHIGWSSLNFTNDINFYLDEEELDDCN